MMSQAEELNIIRKNLKSDKLVYGTEKTIKLLKADKLGKIFLSSNTPGNVEQDIMHYSNLSGVPVVKLDMSNDKLGIFCKKQFFIAVIGLLK